MFEIILEFLSGMAFGSSIANYSLRILRLENTFKAIIE